MISRWFGKWRHCIFKGLVNYNVVAPKWIFSLEEYIKGPLGSFKALQVIIAAVCMLIPLTLKIMDRDEFYPKQLTSAGLAVPGYSVRGFAVDSATSIRDNSGGFQLQVADSVLRIQIGTASLVPKDKLGFRMSVSDYVYGSRSYVFGILYCLAAMLFVFNGVVYLHRRDTLLLRANGHWYNLWIGLFLLGVALCPARVSPLWHVLFSVFFFAGNIGVLLFIANPGESRGSRMVRIGMAVAVCLALILTWTGPLTLLWAEWISLVIIATHLILVTLSVDINPDP